jgi:hypothetical protein
MPHQLMNIFSNKHSTYEMLLTEHIDGVISAADDAKLSQHLATCADCAIDMREQAQIRTLLRAEPLVAVPRSFALPYAPRTIDASEPGPVGRLLRGMQVATATAAMVLVALVGLNVMGAAPSSDARLSSVNTSAGISGDASAPTAASGLAPDSEESAGAVTSDGSDGPTEAAGAKGITDPDAESGQISLAAPAPGTGDFIAEPLPSPEDTTNEFLGTGGDFLIPDEDLLAYDNGLATAQEASPLLAGDGGEDDRPALEWALLAASLITALLAITVVATTWRTRRT